MKKNVLFFFFVILFPLVAYSSGNDAVANPAAVVEECAIYRFDTACYPYGVGFFA